MASARLATGGVEVVQANRLQGHLVPFEHGVLTRGTRRPG